MRKSKKGLTFIACLFMAALIVGAIAQPLSAQVTIPQGSIINSAIFSVYETYAYGEINQLVTLHRITADWGECSVTFESLAGQFDPMPAGSFYTNTYSWRTVDLTALVQAWVNGTPNFGFIMMQAPNIPATAYKSSEAVDLELRPKLEIWFTTPQGFLSHVIIQCTEATPSDVIDVHVRDEVNYCSSRELVTGNFNRVEKYSLVRFNFTVIPYSPGTGTPGYWMNHPEAWPVPGIEIGGVYYPMQDAINLMRMPVATDKTYTMFPALVAAKLNVLIGNDASCISSTISDADAWMTMYPVGSGVAAGGKASPWRIGEPLYLLLDNYNNGLLCAPSRDTIY